MSPLYQRPLDLGVDIVLHSATKFLSGHSDIIAGLAVTKDEELGNRLAFIQNSFGAILGAQDSYTLIQGIKTLGARLTQSSESAQKIASYLNAHSLVEEVFYPGLASHPGHADPCETIDKSRGRSFFPVTRSEQQQKHLLKMSESLYSL